MGGFYFPGTTTVINKDLKKDDDLFRLLGLGTTL